MTPKEVAERMSPSEFTKLCEKVDDKFGNASRFDILSIARVDKLLKVLVVTSSHEKLLVTL